MVGRVTEDVPEGDGVSVAVEFSETVGRIWVPVALAIDVGKSVDVSLSDTVGRGRDAVAGVLVGRSEVSVTLGEIITPVGAPEPLIEVPTLGDPVWLGPVVAAAVPLPEGPVVSTLVADAVSDGTADEPVPAPVNPPEMVGNRVIDASVADASVAVVSAVVAPVPEAPVGDGVASTSLVRLETSEPMLLTTELRKFVLPTDDDGDAEESPVAGPVKPEVIEASLVAEGVLSAVVVPPVVAPVIPPVMSEIKLDKTPADEGVASAEVVAPVVGPVRPEPESKSLVCVGVESDEVVTPVVGPVIPESERATLVVVADACEEVVTPVPGPVADASMVDEPVDVVGRRMLVTSDTTLLTSLVTAETRLLTSLVTAETMPLRRSVVDEPMLEGVGVGVTSLIGDEVEEITIPLDVSETPLLEGLTGADEDETMPVGPITIGVWVEGVAVDASAVDELVVWAPSVVDEA